MAGKLTFKREARETGLASVGKPHPDVQIKHGGKQVGCIAAPTWQTTDNKWAVRLAIVLPSGGWEWFRCKERHDSEVAAREWVKAHEAQILGMKLHRFED